MTGTQKSKLAQLGDAGQAVWLDFVSREFLDQGGLEKLVKEDGLTGVTSNPSIFEKAMGQGTAYEKDLQALLTKDDAEVVDVFEYLAIGDIRAAADTLRPVYDRLDGKDGYVSLEVSPYLADDTQGTLAEARRLWRAVDRPNLMIKVPGTQAGVPAIRQLIEEGINVNVTLLFSRQAYKQVADAYVQGLEARLKAGGDISRLASVASFFVSRIDAAIDKKIDEKLKSGADDALKALKGKVAIANAKMAYQDYLGYLADARWKALAAKGARPQRLLWASTGTKDPSYPDTLYVDSLIGQDTVNTIPPKTMDAFRQAGTVSASLTQDIDGARKVLADAQRFGLDLDGVTTALVPDGTRQFRDAADGLYGAVGAKRIDFLGKKLNAATFELPKPLADAVDKTLDVARSQGWSRRVWSDDASLWTGKDESQWLGWLAAGQGRQVDADAVAALARGLKAEGFTDAVLLGMGGSSLGPEVLSETLGSTGGAPVLHVLDTTNPAQIKVVEDRIDIAHTLFIVSSKSGSTLEPEILNAYFHAAASGVVGKDKAGKQFIAITDPGSKLDAAAKAGGYRAIFHGDPAIGGRYSVLSVFGMVPLGVIGHDVRKFFDTTQTMVHACGPSAPPQVNPGVHLGVILGEAAVAGRDKLTVFASQSVSTVGSWLEQLLAESTGKQGKGIVPVDQEPIGGPESYGQDRLFAYLKVSGDKDDGVDARLKALAAAGHPVVRITLDRADAIGQEFFRWEMATAIAGAVIGIDPFDQPDVEASKLKTRALTDAFEKSGKFDAETAFAKDAGLNFFGDASLKGDGSADAVIKNHLARLKAGDYAAVLAYIERDPANETWIELLRIAIRDAWKVATVGGFGPRFLHSTGQAYKGGPNSGVFLQITADPASDLAIPGRKISFGKVQFAQARGDLEVLAERGRRYLRVHIEGDIQTGLKRIAQAVIKATA